MEDGPFAPPRTSWHEMVMSVSIAPALLLSAINFWSLATQGVFYAKMNAFYAVMLIFIWTYPGRGNSER